MELLTNGGVRVQAQKVLAGFAGISSPRFRWLMEREDGDYDAPGPSGGPGGPVVAAEKLEGRKTITVLLEELP